MNPLRSKALKLRLTGKSYNEISKELGIAKSTLSLWFKDLLLSDNARTRLQKRMRQGVENGLIKRNKQQTIEAEKRARQSRAQARKQIKIINAYELRLIGTALYWAEGYKRLIIRNGKERMGHTIRFLNADGEMIRLFVRFLKESCDVPKEKIILTMRLYPHISEHAAREYWKKMTSLSNEQFRKTISVVSGASNGVRPYNRLPWGTLEVEVRSTAKFHHLMGWIEGVKDRI